MTLRASGKIRVSVALFATLIHSPGFAQVFQAAAHPRVVGTPVRSGASNPGLNNSPAKGAGPGIDYEPDGGHRVVNRAIKVIRIDDDRIKNHLDRVAWGSVEET
jgi:hypothetical protein